MIGSRGERIALNYSQCSSEGTRNEDRLSALAIFTIFFKKSTVNDIVHKTNENINDLKKNDNHISGLIDKNCTWLF